MQSNPNKNETIVGIIEFIVGFILIGGICYGIWCATEYQRLRLEEQRKALEIKKAEQRIDDAAIFIAKKSLLEQKPIEIVHEGVEYVCVFEKNEDFNVAVVSYRGKTYVRKDYNKSLLVGKYVGEKSKEMVKGLFQGLKAKGKHDD